MIHGKALRREIRHSARGCLHINNGKLSLKASLTPFLSFVRATLQSIRDLAPIVAVIAVFQLVVIGEPLPDWLGLLAGTAVIVAGLSFFIFGLEMGLFPLGESMAYAFVRKGSLLALLLYAFALGFGTTVAEPALIAVTGEAADAAAETGTIGAGQEDRDDYALGMRITVALSVGLAIVLGVIRILKGWPIHVFIIAGYLLVVVLTAFAPKEIIGIAYDSGGVTTSTITVPMVTALGIGLASAIRGRSPMVDGFGLIAFASLTPIIFVLVYGMLI
jgi:hypothetical protein